MGPRSLQCLSRKSYIVKRYVVNELNDYHLQVAHDADDLDVQLAAVIYRDMLQMVQQETELRKKLKDLVNIIYPSFISIKILRMFVLCPLPLKL